MNRLKRTWNDNELNELRRGLSRLVSPFETERDFRIFLQLPGETASAAREVEPPQVINYPHYSISGNVASDGRFELKARFGQDPEDKVLMGWFRHASLSSSSEVVERADGDALEETLPPVCGPISFRILVWDRDRLDDIDQKLGTGIRSIRKDLNSIAGVSIYRDGFRVLPFGEPDDDWLRLDIRRVQNPTLRLSNNQLTGYISIGADTNPLLRDQSNREGLDNNEAYADLQSIMVLTLSKLESLRYLHKKARQQVERPPSGGLLDAPNVESLRQRLKSQVSVDDETMQLFEDATRRWELQIGRIRDVLSRYHSLATLGQLVDKVVHDTRQPLSTIQGQAAMAQEVIDGWIGSADAATSDVRLTSLDNRLQRIRAAAGLIDGVLRRIEPLGGRSRGRPSEQYLEAIIRSAFELYSQNLEELGVTVTLPADQTLVRVDASELQQVFINLLSNSLEWLKEIPKSRRAIVVQCSRPQDGEVQIVFADSGPGIPLEDREAIFAPYFTTKRDGIGLGLVIAGEIVRDYYNGTLDLMDSGPLGGAVFRILLRKRV
jgi:signal transduction histidine kinase